MDTEDAAVKTSPHLPATDAGRDAPGGPAATPPSQAGRDGAEDEGEEA